MANILTLTVDDPDQLLNAGAYGTGAIMRVQSAATETGSYADISGTGSTPTVALAAGTLTYAAYDPAGASTTWYRTRYENAGATRLSDWCAPFIVAAAVPGVYASLASLRSLLFGTGAPTAADESLMALALSAAAAAIRSTCQRDFHPPTGTSESRLFALSSYLPPTIDIDDLVDATGLTIAFDDGTGTYPTTVTTGYDLLPLNAPTKGFPYTAISFRTYTVVPAWRLSGPFVKITSARWGWPATPSAVTQANLIQAARLFKRKDSPFGIAGAAVEGNVLRLLAKLDPDVQLLLDGDLMRFAGFVA